MMDQDGIVPLVAAQMSVDFGGEYAFVAQHHLDISQVRAVLDQMGRE